MLQRTSSRPSSASVLGTQGTGANAYGPDRITRNVWDAAGQLLQVQRAVGTSVQQNEATYTYSLNGRRTSVTDANGNRAEMTWDGHDRQQRWIFPSPSTPGAVNGGPTQTTGDYEEYGYDLAGNRTSLRKRDGTTITYQYDALNQMVFKTVPGSTTGAASYGVHYRYDVFGAQIHALFGSASGAGVVNAYDGFGRLTSTTTSMGGTSRTLSYAYDPGGRRERLTYPTPPLVPAANARSTAPVTA